MKVIAIGVIVGFALGGGIALAFKEDAPDQSVSVQAPPTSVTVTVPVTVPVTIIPPHDPKPDPPPFVTTTPHPITTLPPTTTTTIPPATTTTTAPPLPPTCKATITPVVSNGGFETLTVDTTLGGGYTLYYNISPHDLIHNPSGWGGGPTDANGVKVFDVSVPTIYNRGTVMTVTVSGYAEYGYEHPFVPTCSVQFQIG